MSLTAGGQTLAARYARLERPAIAQTAAVHDDAFAWQGLRLLLARGRLALDATVPAQLTTAVFTGEGTFQVLAPEAIEAAQMRRFTGRSPLDVQFTQAVFRFADGADFMRALGTALRFQPGGNAEAEKLLRERAQAGEKQGSPAVARLLQALGRHPASTILLVQLKLRNGAWISAQFDPSRREPLRVYQWSQGGGRRIPEIWTQFTPETAVAPPAAPRLNDYAISAAISGHFELAAAAAFKVTDAGKAVLLGLDPGLRVESVTSGGAALAWLQPKDAGWVYVELPAAGAGRALPLELRYRGKAPLLGGAGSHEESSLPGWYPTLPLDPPWAWREEPASFDLRLETGKKYTLLATGSRVSERAAGATVISEWRSPGAVVRAGFQFGEDRQARRRLRLADGRSLEVRLAAPEHNDPDALLPLAGTRLESVINFFGGALGPYPYAAANAYVSGVSSNAELMPAQPTLMAFDPQSFLDLSPAATYLAPALSVAGQWFGGWMRPATAHDEWLTDGLQAFSGLRYEESHVGATVGLATLRIWRNYLLHPGRGHNLAPVATGPLWLGEARLDARGDSGKALLLAKGAYVLYMLQQMMANPRSPQPNAAFDAMLRDFVRSYGGRAVTSAEFQAVVEKHMTPPMNLSGDHTMDWFFKPAIEGTAVPTLSFHAANAGTVRGVAQVKLTVENPDGWVGLLPVYLFRDANTWVRGEMPITQPQVTLTVPAPFVPKYVEADHLLDMLVHVRQ